VEYGRGSIIKWRNAGVVDLDKAPSALERNDPPTCADGASIGAVQNRLEHNDGRPVFTR